MNNNIKSIKEVFDTSSSENRKTNIGYIVAGYPDIEFTKNFLLNLDKTSIDILELGIPYSDPLADGKLISDASFKASQAGITTDTVFNLLLDIKGLIIPDLPYEESEFLFKKLSDSDIALIPLVSVTSQDRIEKIVSRGSGFIYAVGSLGVTGSIQVSLERLETFISNIRSKSDLPVSLGFGIKNNENVRTMRKYADGVIIGTSIVSLTSSGNLEYTINEINNFFE